MFSATIFLKIKCDNNVLYTLRTLRRRIFEQAPQKGFTMAVEKGVGNCIVRDVKMSNILGKQPENTIDLDCQNICDELMIEGLLETGNWKLVINSTFAFDKSWNEIDEDRTRKFQKRLRDIGHERRNSRSNSYR